MRKRSSFCIALFRIILLCMTFSLTAGLNAAEKGRVYEAEAAQTGPEINVVDEELFSSRKGVSRQNGDARLRQKKNLRVADFKIDVIRPADLTFKMTVKKPGLYKLTSTATTEPTASEFINKARSKMDSLCIMLSVDDRFPSSRVVVPAWKKTKSWKSMLGIFRFKSTEATVRVWLPDGVVLDALRLEEYYLPRVPKEAAEYRPSIVPAKEHPRLWVTPKTIETIKQHLTEKENAPVWQRVQKEAAAPFRYTLPADRSVEHDGRLLRYIQQNAFVWLMTSDRKAGRRAIDLAISYLDRVEYGNMLDITRELGTSIYTGALVFDWCHALLSESEKSSIYDSMLRLSVEMETGWPPFRQSIIIGHGNEAQICRDLLAMSIAIYEMDPLPYQYCSYRILEELVPMRRFEYESSRHNQGIAYVGARLYWEYLSATMFKRMTGQEVFDPNIKRIRDWFLFMRLPNGELLRDGDVYLSGSWWSFPQLALAQYSYSNDSVMKGEYFRQRPKKVDDPIQFLLLNDPELTADSTYNTLGLGYDSGKILCSQIVRTGWNMNNSSADTVVEFKGGQFHFGNHQHGDTGSFQIFHRGLLAADLGVYRFYGTEYDYNFNKRSISHNVLLVYDPDEKFFDGSVNDGGQRFVWSNPGTPSRTLKDAQYRTGNLLASEFFPSREKPEFTFFSVECAPAYSPKVSEYVRSFCWIRTDQKDIPVAVLVFDRVTTSKASYKKYWQINTLTKPEPVKEGGWAALSLKSINFESASNKRGRIQILPLLPGADKINCELIGDERANSVFGHQLKAPADLPECKGWRIMLTPKKKCQTDLFLNLLLIGDDVSGSIPVKFSENKEELCVTVAGKIVRIDRLGRLISCQGADGRQFKINQSKKVDQKKNL